MGPAPTQIGGAKVLWFTPIDERHRKTGNGCHQVYRASEQPGAVAGLAICQPPDDTVGFYVFGCDAEWQSITDTWHESVELAKTCVELHYEGALATLQQADSSVPGSDER
jgi:hypothetical protein